MNKQIGLFEITGTDCNRVKIGGRTELLGNKDIKREKPHTIIGFPGGTVEIARTEDGDYWVHVAVRGQTDGTPAAGIVCARIDPAGRYADAANAAMNDEIAKDDVQHIAFLVRPRQAATTPNHTHSTRQVGDQMTQKHTGDLIITRANAENYAGLTEVTGHLYINADAKLDALTSVGGYLDINADAKLDALTSVGGHLDINADAKLDALTSVGGSLDIRADAKLDALTSVGGYLDIRADAKLDAPALTKVAGHDLPSPEVAAERIRDVAAAALLSPQALDMKDWHSCATTHCIAGWGIHQAGPDGYKLEKEVGSAAAGAILLGLEAASMFHATTAKARKWLKAKAGEGGVVA